jgi:3-dehydroquinate synthase
MHSTLNINSKIKNYSVEFVSSLTAIIDLISNSNTISFIDSNIVELYPELNLANIISVKCSEDVKNLEGASLIYSALVEKKANINSKLVVIGGGILQDLVGFCSSTYCRGIDYILIPTTLLAQVDSCVGGKTSLNFKNKKNILGTFYPPSKIIIYPKFIQTLSNLDLISGFGEIYKFHILQDNILNFNIQLDLTKMIYDGLKFKIDVLSRDEFDKGERKYLNFGHTFGHALETISLYKIPHGVAVSIGCMIAVMLSKELGYTINNFQKVLNDGLKLVRSSNIKFKQEWFDFDQLMHIIKSDKKSTGKLTMVLIDNKPFLRDIEEHDILLTILKKIYETI